MKKLCIYHGKCADGFTAAWIISRALGDEVEFHPGVYQDPPPDTTGRDVIMADFSYKKPVLVAMASMAKSVLILDHHASAQADLSEFIGEDHSSVEHGPWFPDSGIHALFDMNRSGAGMTWDYFHRGQPRPALVDYVEDRDLWRFKLPNSRAVNAFIFSHDYDFDTWDQLGHNLDFADTMSLAEKAGEAIERKHHKDVAELVGVCKRRMKIGGHVVWGASLPYTLTSDAGHLMAEPGEPFAACYWDTPEGRVFSLRSRDDGMNVAEIAKQYGGGGHPHASGFRVPFDQIGQFEGELYTLVP